MNLKKGDIVVWLDYSNTEQYGYYLKQHDELPDSIWCFWSSDLKKAKAYNGGFDPAINEVEYLNISAVKKLFNLPKCFKKVES